MKTDLITEKVFDITSWKQSKGILEASFKRIISVNRQVLIDKFCLLNISKINVIKTFFNISSISMEYGLNLH